MSAGTPGLLVTGMARSGTSWVGKMVQASRRVVYLNEPLNPGHPPGRSPGVLNADVTHQYQYIGGEARQWRRAFADTLALRYGFRAELRRNRSTYDLARLVKYGTAMTLGRLLRRAPLLDDPFALYATPWLVRNFGLRAVVLVRDPVAVAGSYHRLGWRMRFDQLLGPAGPGCRAARRPPGRGPRGGRRARPGTQLRAHVADQLRHRGPALPHPARGC